MGNTPNIRFKGFTDDWEQRKLGEICQRVIRKNKNNESDLPLTIASQYGLIDQRDFFNKVVAAKDMSNYYLLRKGEFAYNKSYSNGFEYGSIKRLNAYEQGCLSTLYICFEITSDEVDSDYLECFFDTLKWYGDLSMICAEGARNHGLLNVDIKAFFADINVSTPTNLKEQRKIATYLNNLDHLITLHQRKLFLNFVKKNDWEQRKLNEVAEFNPKSELPDEFEYVDLESVVGTEMISHRTETKDSAPSRAQRLAQPGDVFFQTVRPYQKNNYLFSKLDNNYVFSTGYAQMRPNIDTAFLMSFLQTDSFVKIVLDNCTGTSYPAINSNDLSNLEISLPKSFEEQKKVGKTIISIDNLITLHQRKCDETKKLKKFMLQKMFPKKDANKPEIRFAGFTDDWEQRKWIDTVDISTEMVDPTTGEYDDMPHIAPGNIEPFTGRILDNVKTVKEEQLISGKFRFRPNDVVYGKINPQLGKYFYASIDGLTSADAYVFNGKNGITQKFLYSVLQTKDFFKYSISVSKRSGMPKINRDELNAYSFCVPKEEEQEKIGDFLLGIDNLITLHRRAYYNKKGGLTNVHNDNQQHYAIL